MKIDEFKTTVLMKTGPGLDSVSLAFAMKFYSFLDKAEYYPKDISDCLFLARMFGKESKVSDQVTKLERSVDTLRVHIENAMRFRDSIVAIGQIANKELGRRRRGIPSKDDNGSAPDQVEILTADKETAGVGVQ